MRGERLGRGSVRSSKDYIFAETTDMEFVTQHVKKGANAHLVHCLNSHAFRSNSQHGKDFDSTVQADWLSQQQVLARECHWAGWQRVAGMQVAKCLED